MTDFLNNLLANHGTTLWTFTIVAIFTVIMFFTSKYMNKKDEELRNTPLTPEKIKVDKTSRYRESKNLKSGIKDDRYGRFKLKLTDGSVHTKVGALSAIISTYDVYSYKEIK